MLLREKTGKHMVEVRSMVELLDLNCTEVHGCYQEGEEVQDMATYKKTDLVFLSGEELPRCWTDSHYRDAELSRH